MLSEKLSEANPAMPLELVPAKEPTRERGRPIKPGAVLTGRNGLPRAVMGRDAG